MLSPPYPTSARHIIRLLERDDCPFDSNVQAHPVDVDRFRVWYDTTVAPNNPRVTAALGLGGGGGAMYQVKLRLIAEQTLWFRRRREQLEGRFIPRDQHEQVLRDYVTFCRDRFEQWIDSIPPLLEGLDPDGVAAARIVMRDAYDQLCSDMQAVTTLPPADDRDAEPLQNPNKAKAARARWKSKQV